MSCNKSNNKNKNSKNILINKNDDNQKLEIAKEIYPVKNIGSMLGNRIDKKKINRPS